ncbi:MAG: inositol monophosphatase, partial [Vogesella sp.]|nr:inositol monophosphatase [Vogesella sp.]
MQVVDQVIQVVRDVARYEVMPRFLRVGKTRKEDGSLFTEADLACQQVLQQRLPAILPYPVLGEEM